MKIQILIIFVLHFINVNHIICQFVVPELSFVSAKPEWVYIPKDSNFVISPKDPWSTPYSNKNSWRLDIHQEKLYLFQTTFSQNPYLGHDGYILHKLVITTGAPEWTLHNNYNSGVKYREYYLSTKFEFTSDEKLKIIGLKDFDQLDTTKPSFFFYGKPFLKTIDLKSGNIENVIESTAKKHDKIYSSTAFGSFNRYTKVGNQYFTLISKPFIENDTLKDAVELRKISDPFNIDTTSFTAVINNTFIPTDVTQLSTRPIFDFVNDSIFVALFSINNPEDLSQSPEKVWLSKIEITNEGEMNVLKKVEITDEFYFPQDQNFSYYKIIKDKNIFVYQTMISDNSPHSSKKFTWLLWADEDCNKKAKFGALKDGDRFYLLPEFISATSNKAIIAAYFEDEKNKIKGYDLLELRNTGEIIRLGGFQVSSNAPKILLQRAVITSDSSLIVAFRTEVPYNNGFTDYSYLMKFKPEILKPISTISIDDNFLPISFNITPNPSKDIIYLNIHNNDINQCKIDILDSKGNVLVTKMTNSPRMEFDISLFSSGLYFVSLKNLDGKQIGTLSKFVKM